MGFSPKISILSIIFIIIIILKCYECHALVNGYMYNNSTSNGSRAVYVYSGAVCCSGGAIYIYITIIVGKQAGQ